MDDLEFDELIRDAVAGIADNAPQPYPFPTSSTAVDHGDGSRGRDGWKDGRGRLALVAVAAVIALAGGWLTSNAGWLDRSIDIEATDDGAVPNGSRTGTGSGWPTMMPGAELIPPDALEPGRFIFGPGDEPANVVGDYLADRLADLAAAPGGLAIQEIETVDGHAVFGWSYDIADVNANGWVYLLEAERSWWVVAAISEGVDAHRVFHDLQRVAGLVTSAGDEPLVIDLVDIDTGDPFQPATGEALGVGPMGRRQLGTAGRSERLGDAETIEIDTPVGREQFAIRIQAVGGTPLTITEFTVRQGTAEEPAGLESTTCAVTRPPEVAFVPPQPWPATPPSDDWAWYGTDELWTVIEIDGSTENKSVWWSAEFPGGTDEPNPPLTVTFERLDADVAPIEFDAPGTNAFTTADQWFMINGLEPREPGCWRATATYKGTTLSYTYEVP